MFADFPSLLRAHAASDPDRVALTFAPSHLDARRITLTYADLAARSERMAHLLAARLSPGDRALILLPAAPEFAIAFLGCLGAGVIAVPVPPPADDSSRRRVLNVARDCSPAVVISIALVRDLVAAGPPDISAWGESAAWLLTDAGASSADTAAAPSGPAGTAGLPAVRADDVAFLQYTSGSTRSPRGVLVTHCALMSNEAAISRSFGVRQDSVIVSWLPLHHDMGLVGGLLQPVFARARGFILDPLDFVRRPASWLEAISAERADISGGPNFAYDLCARKVSDAEKAGLDLSSWRVAFNGSGQVFPASLRRFSAAFGPAGFSSSAHLPCYGLAEATLLVASAEPGGGGRASTFCGACLEAGTAHEVGQGVPDARELVAYRLPSHARVRVADPGAATLAGQGRSGEILVAGDGNGAGYWDDPAGTAATFGAELAGQAGAFLRTGDLGFVHHGELYIQGRIKDLIVHRGRNLHAADLEADIWGCHRSVRPGCGAVFGVEQAGDEVVVICQEIQQDTPPRLWPQIASSIRGTIASGYGVQAHSVVLLPPRTITKTSSGKVQRQAARQRYLAGELPVLAEYPAGPADLDAPRLADRLRAAGPELARADARARPPLLSRLLRQYLKDVLGLDRTPDGGESLASLGADSLMAMQLQHAVQDALDVTLPPSLTLRAASINDLAAAAASAPRAPRHADAAETGAAAGDAAAGDGGYELNAAQRALWFLHRAFAGSTDYNVTRAFRITGDLDHDALSAALAALVRRHPSLRLAVRDADGEPEGIQLSRPVVIDRADGRGWDAAAQAAWYRDLATRPFDLEREPLLRAATLRRDEDWLFALSLHHIVCDVSSLALLVAELASEYSWQSGAGGPGLGPSAPPGPSPALIERTALAERGTELSAYWQRELAGELPVLALPKAGQSATGHDTPGQPGPAGSVRFAAPGGLAAELAALARRSGLTMHNVLLAAYQVLLHRLTGQADLIVGVPVSGRADRRLASWVGYLVNVLPIRSELGQGRTFADFASRTQDRMLDALDHQDLPLSHITRLVNPGRDSARSMIFQAMFAFYTSALPGGAAAAGVVTGDPSATLPMGECALHGHPVADYTAQAELGLNACVSDRDLWFEIQYDDRNVSRGQAEQIRDAFMTLLSAIGTGQVSGVLELPLLTDAAVAGLVAASTGPSVRRPGHYLSSFEEVAASTPDAIAADDGTASVSYAELDQRANHAAAVLREAGASTDACVVMCAERSVDYLVAMLGIHKAGACYVPISPGEAPRRAAAMLRTVRPVAAIAGASGRALLDAALAAIEAPADDGAGSPPVLLDLATLAAGRSSHRVPRACPDGGACTIIHTSGSTGAPKAAVSTNYGVTNHMWQMIEHFGLGAGDCLAQTGPVSFDISVWQMLTPLIVGGRVRIVPEPDSQSPAALLRATIDGAVTMLELVPSAIVALLDAGLAADPGALRVMLSTGEALTPEVLRRWVSELPGIPLHNAYGPAECTDDVTAGLCAHGHGGRATVSIGRPLANTCVYVLDDNLVPVPPGVVGMLHVGGGAVGRGYLRDPRRTAEVFLPDPWSAAGGRMYRTGDLARWTASMDLEFLGRADTQTKIRGLRIEAGEVEGALRRVPGVTEAAIKVHHGPAGSVLVGYVAAGDQAESAGPPGRGQPLSAGDDERMRAALAQFLPRYMIPTLLVGLPRLPRTPNGKVDYRALHYAAAARGGQDERHRIDDPLATAIRSVWAALLQRDDIGWDDSFFELGGHSLLALAMTDRVGQLLEADLQVDAVFTAPRLARFVEAARRASPLTPGRVRPPAAAAGPRYPAPASAAQERFWYLHEIDPGQPTYNMPGVLRIRGDLDAGALERAMGSVLARHDVLLARFSDDHGALTWTPAPAADFRLPQLDLRGAVAEFGEEVFAQLVEGEANTAADLRRESPFRAMLARLGADEWGLLVVVDHIVCDGWSLSVFLGELAASYNKLIGGQPLAAGRPEYSFADFCGDERAWRDAGGAGDVAAQWQGTADGPVSLSPLPERSTEAGDAGAGIVTCWIDADLAAAIGELAGRTGVTPFIVFATALSALIHQGTAERETVLVGTLIAQRDRPELREVIGPLLNVSVLAADLALTDSVTDALRRTRDGALRAYRCGHVPFQELARLFRPAPGGDGSPFEVMLVLQPPGEQARFAGLTTELTDIVPAVAAYPLTVDIERRDAGYQVSLRFETARFDPADVARLADRLESALHAIVTDLDRPLAGVRSAAAVLQGERT